MTETDPCNDVTPPCVDCGDCALPCACGKPIETVAQLQRALEAIGPSYSLTVSCECGDWTAKLYSPVHGSFSCDAATVQVAIGGAIQAYWDFQ